MRNLLQAIHHACFAHKPLGYPIRDCKDCAYKELVRVRLERPRKVVIIIKL